MASALPLLLVGGAALLLMGRKKKAPANGKQEPPPLEPLPSVTSYPPPPGKVSEALNVIQFKIVGLDHDEPGIGLIYDQNNPTSVAFRTTFGHMAKANPDVIFTAVPLSFVEYIVEEDPEAAAGDPGAIADMLKSGVYSAIIDASGHDAGVKDDPAKFGEEMAIALEETRKEIKRRAEEG